MIQKTDHSGGGNHDGGPEGLETIILGPVVQLNDQMRLGEMLMRDLANPKVFLIG